MKRQPLFVYGSLKEGFPNFHVNRGRRVAGAYVTSERHELWLIDGRLPCLLAAAGGGQHVLGQLFEVSPGELAAMDHLERLGKPGGYQRIEIVVQPPSGGSPAPLRAFVYVQSAALLQQPGEHLGPLAEYTLEHARRLRW